MHLLWIDTVEHTAIRCVRRHVEREIVCLAVGEDITPYSVTRIMITSARNWETVRQMFDSIMETKFSDERRRQGEGRLEGE